MRAESIIVGVAGFALGAFLGGLFSMQVCEHKYMERLEQEKAASRKKDSSKEKEENKEKEEMTKEPPKEINEKPLDKPAEDKISIVKEETNTNKVQYSTAAASVDTSKNTDIDKPIIITESAFSSECPAYEKRYLYWYTQNRVLIDTESGQIVDEEGTVGRSILRKWPERGKVWVRNDGEATDYEVTFIDGRYIDE